ncbi:MAG TPA: hypothetical protein VGF20_15750 [Candidatus Acidoferrum sp.]|jgi:hypothetical protein
MMASIIFVCSLILMLQFFVSYCRSLIAASAKEQLSVDVQEVTGISRAASPEDFTRVVQLLNLCPDRPEDRGELRAISAYYHLLSFVRSTIARVAPSLKSWADSERAQCTYFAAVILGRRIAFSRNLLAQQMLP